MSQSPLPRFNDTAQAFQHLTDAELRRAVALFSLIGKPWLVNAGSALANVALALRVPLGWAVRPTVYAHFCGGESIDDSEATIAKLSAHNVRTILDYSAEGQTAEADLDATCSEVLATIQRPMETRDMPLPCSRSVACRPTPCSKRWVRSWPATPN